MTDTLFNLDDYTTSSSKPVHDPYWDEIVLDCSGKVETSSNSFPEHSADVLEEVQRSFPEQVKQWVEKYFVTRAGTKHWYYRYCYYRKKIHHIHINGGNTSSRIAQRRKQMVEDAIACGKSPDEIKKLIKGVFGL